MTVIRWLAPAFMLCALGACSGNNSTLSVTILVPPDDDPFQGASQVRMTVGTQVTTTPVTAGKFDASLKIDSPDMSSYVTLDIEALDSSGGVVGRGLSPPFVLVTMDSALTVFVGRPGKVNRTAVSLLDDNMQTAGRAGLCGASLRGRQGMPPDRALGVLLAGGSDASGKVLSSAYVYDPLTHKLLPGGTLVKDRSGAVAVPSTDASIGQQALIWGGAAADGSLPTTAEVFDPSQSSLSAVFGTPAMGVADAGAPGAIAPVAAEVKDEVFLVTGGHDGKGPLPQAVLLERFPAPASASDQSARPGVQRIPAVNGRGPMAAARDGHTATPVTLGDGPGVLLFGGLSDADAMMMNPTVPVAEVFDLAQMKFNGLPLTMMVNNMPVPVPSRRGHAAIALMDGTVAVLGGVDSGTGAVTGDVLIIDARAGTAVLREKLLATARQGASLTAAGGEFVLCGGTDVNGKAIANCEVFAGASAQDFAKSRDPILLANARSGHLALALETTQVLLLGGHGADGKPLAPIDLYTPIK